MDTDLKLMLRVRSGDGESFDELLRRHRMPLLNYFYRMLRDHALAEDLAQEVFLSVYKARDRYEPDAKFTTWLYRIATNLALNAIRDRRGKWNQADEHEDEGEPQEARFVDSRPTVEQQLMQSDRGRLVREAVEALPENQRAAVILHKYQEVDYKQIAQILDLSESAVKSLLFRAYESLRVRLEPLLKGGQL